MIIDQDFPCDFFGILSHSCAMAHHPRNLHKDLKSGEEIASQFLVAAITTNFAVGCGVHLLIGKYSRLRVKREARRVYPYTTFIGQTLYSGSK